MGHSNLRSLLVAAIVISNCITWTASRHHYTHNVHGHRSRHRRQGAGLFLSSSYVIPGGEGGGAWGEWGEVSPCSRTCGGGVASQKRICLQVSPDGQSLCSGGDTKFFSCQTQDCPDDGQDFRAQQCAEYNDVAFKGIKYNWVPYTKGPKPCELNCMPQGERFYYRQKTQVVDGTRCNDESFDVCVNGTCQPVGCDMMLGSPAREDKCRECRGNGANCHTAKNILDTKDFRNGYNDVLLIPAKATNIYIAEIRPSSNYLALRATTNDTYYLNGYYHIDFPRSINIAGATWHYERSQNGLPSPDKLKCLGPTDEPLFLSLLVQEPNVGIEYEYSIPKALAPPPNQEYNWVHEEFTPCSATCGGGIQTRNVTCRSREELEVVDDGLCNEAFKPDTNQTCNTNACPAEWIKGPWGACTKHCGKGGTRARQVHCEKIISNGYHSVVANKECIELLGPMPALYEECNQNATCPIWFTGPWKPCDKLCDEGKQTRQVVCYQKTDGRVEVLDDKECDDEKPPAEQPCMLHPCEGVDWVVTDWAGCDTCLSKVRTRTALCATKHNQVYNSSFCSFHTKPVLEEKCDPTELPPCEVQWYATQWSKCSAECGKGVRTRRVFCGMFDGESVLKVADDRCDQSTKYNDTRECEVKECPAMSYAGPWTECSALCDGGLQTRRVMCLRGTEPSKDCNISNVLDSTQACNVKPCNADEVTVVGPNPTPIMDDYDEECEPEDEYPEVGAMEDDSVSAFTDDMFSDSPYTPELPASFSEIESEFTDAGSGETLITEGSGFDTTESTFSTDEWTSDETGSTDETSFTTTDETTESGATDTSSPATEATVVKISASTDESSPKSSDSTDSTVESSSIESTNDTESTESTIEGSSSSEYDIDYTDETSETETSESGATESSDLTTVSGSEEPTSPSGSTEPTESKPTGSSESSDVTTVSGATEPESTGETETTESEDIDETESSATNETEESEATDSTLSSESSPTDETSESSSETTYTEAENTEGSTESGSTESPGSTESGKTSESSATDETTEAGSTITDESDKEGSTEVSGSTEPSATEAGSTTESGSTVSGATETSVTTESGATEVSKSSETTEAGTTESPGSTESGTTQSGSTESGSTESGATTVSGSTGSESTDLSGSTTESGLTEETSEDSSKTSISTEATENESEETEFTESSSTEGSTEFVSKDTGSTVSATEETGFTETGTTESGLTESSDETTVSGGSTPWDWATTIGHTKRKCLPRTAKCTKSQFGCCPDRKTPAAGPFEEGCQVKRTCAETQYKCCPDGVSPAAGPNNKGCPTEPCEQTLFGCCKSDNKTASEGNDDEGCPPPQPPCKSSKHGCCKDEKTEATGPGKAGCPETVLQKAEEKKEGESATTTVLPEEADCNATEFGCCPDGVSPAAGAQMEGCVLSCNSSAYGCCPDGETPAHGYDYEGCCLLSPHGCCPDNFKPADGPHLEGCGCQYAHFGCCPDNVTIASGPNKEGCGCQYTEHGCCPDKHTPASGPEYEGCDCHTYQFGCCDDGFRIAKGPGKQGCLCQQSEFGCCGDGKTAAVGPDQLGCDCSTSKFGCCPDGQTPANGTKFLGCTDKPENRQAACALSTDRGPCTNYSVYWYYDLQYGGCSRFWYGGCEGNGNRFTSKDECEDVCVQPSPKDACNLPKVKGACTGYHPRWYFDTEREQCGQFIFGGCLGNANNFDSRELCQKQCEPAKSDDQCSLPIERGTCAGNFLRYGFNAETRRCEPFVWGGCGGNSNRFRYDAACQHHCNPPGVPQPRCKEPQETGNCTEKQALWSFSQTEDRCVPFYYTGCGGNDNRFDSPASCAEACPSSYVKDICTLPALTGECADYTEKWYYDTAIQRCRQFYYGGCGGNENRFSSLAECEGQCAAQTTTLAPPTPPQAQTAAADLCTLPSVTGECDKYTEKWFYDSSISRCRQFYYGGCGGNENRFASERECEARCAPAPTTTRAHTRPAPAYGQEVCFMETDSGPCTDFQTRWAYDAARGTCIEFNFGGCGGNQNNFPSEDYCHRTCGSTQDLCQLPMLSGPCEDSVMSWFYDPTSDSCSQFTYSGCGGNANRFENLEDCERRCRTGPEPVTVANTTVAANITTPVTPVEALPLACRVSPSANEECADEGEVWFLDAEQHACVSYMNAATGHTCRRSGVFLSEEACERSCGAFRNLEVCRYPVDPGPCRAAIPKFYFNEALGSCVSFAYGGCHGGPNRFSTVDECEDVCKFEKDPCKRTPKPINCFDYVTTWFFDESRDECFQYGSCDASDSNRFATREECEGQCRRQPPALTTTTTTLAPTLTTAAQPAAGSECATPASLAACGGAVPVFYYDAQRRACGAAAFGGCGHPNSYRSEEECERRCGAFLGLDPCRYPLDVGGCDSAIPKYYWKLSSGRCEPYAYSGCGGGPNRFSSEQECQEVCGGTGPEPACLEPVSVGQECDESQSRRWYYNEEDGQCLVFLYQGCGGGRNNFLSLQECEASCHTRFANGESNEVLPDCDAYNAECAALACPFGVQRTRGGDGCERCACVPVQVDCAPLRAECEGIKCAYGIDRAVGADGCERCTCFSHPCENKECPSGERCVATPYQDPLTQEIAYTADCRVVNKPGQCPAEAAAATAAGAEAEGRCRRECNDDADCRGVGKCCRRGCSQLCLEPSTPTSPAPVTTTFAPELPQAPQANPVTEPEVTAAEGGRATLRCLFHGNPPPKITWRRGEITIDGDVGRYRLMSDGALEIVSLYRNDSGVYICVAENVHGISQQEIRLQVNDPMESPAGISGDPSAVVVGELGRSLNIRCLAYGFPQPSIYWYYGRTMLPYSSELYEARENVLQIRKLEVETLGEYSCQAFNGVGKAALWSVQVRAYRPDERWQHPLLVPRARTVAITPAARATPPTTQTTPPPEIDMPVYTVPVNTSIPYEQLTQAVGAELSLPCEVDGYPLPEIYWTKDGVRLTPNSRTQITDARLTVSGLTEEDSGVYGCHALNEYSSHSSQIQITVQGVFIPAHCTDNPFFADCKLIVRSKFCNHQYYSRFCCASCVKAGQLNALELGAQADEAWKRKK